MVHSATSRELVRHHAPQLKPLLVPLAVKLDDKLGNGDLKPVKKWWFDLEVVNGVCVDPPKGINQRGLDVTHKPDPSRQKMAYYPANVMPTPNDLSPQPTDRKAAIAAGETLKHPTG